MAKLYCLCESTELGNRVIDDKYETYEVQTNRQMECIKTGSKRIVAFHFFDSYVDIFECHNCGRKIARG